MRPSSRIHGPPVMNKMIKHYIQRPGHPKSVDINQISTHHKLSLILFNNELLDVRLISRLPRLLFRGFNFDIVLNVLAPQQH